MGEDMQGVNLLVSSAMRQCGRWRRAQQGERMRHVGVLLPAPTIPTRLFSAPLLGQALGARLLLVG
jgi:hypothetical protein